MSFLHSYRGAVFCSEGTVVRTDRAGSDPSATSSGLEDGTKGSEGQVCETSSMFEHAWTFQLPARDTLEIAVFFGYCRRTRGELVTRARNSGWPRRGTCTQRLQHINAEIGKWCIHVQADYLGCYSDKCSMIMQAEADDVEYMIGKVVSETNNKER